MDFNLIVQIIDSRIKMSNVTLKELIVKKIVADAYNIWYNDFLHGETYDFLNAFALVKEKYQEDIHHNDMYEMNHSHLYSQSDIELWSVDNSFLKSLINHVIQIENLLAKSDSKEISYENVIISPFTAK